MREESRRHKKALDAFNKGKVKKARKILLELRNTMQDDRLKVDVDLALVSCLNQADDHGLLLEITTEGIALSEKHALPDAQAVFCGRKAVTLLQKQSSIIHRMKCVKLPPEWFEFATEREENEYQKLKDGLKNIGLEADSLLDKARELASKDPAVQFQLLFEEAQVRNQMLDAFFFIHQRPSKLGFKLRRWTMSRERRLELARRLDEIKTLYLLAAQKLNETGDETGFAYCYFNLALAYRGLWKYRIADSYFRKAEEVATRHKLRQILRGIAEVRKDLNQTNILGEDVEYKDFLVGL